LWSLHNLKKAVQIGTTKQDLYMGLPHISDHTDHRNGNKCS